MTHNTRTHAQFIKVSDYLLEQRDQVRLFNGKQYYLKSAYVGKDAEYQARGWASMYRTQGFYARVLHQHGLGWVVYAVKKEINRQLPLPNGRGLQMAKRE